MQKSAVFRSLGSSPPVHNGRSEGLKGDPVLDESATGCSRKCVQSGIVPHSCEVVGEGGGGRACGAADGADVL